MSAREELLDAAKEAVTKHRNNEYGPPTQDFQRTVDMLNVLGFKFEYSEGITTGLSSHHVAMIMICLKLSRLSWDPYKEDSWLDVAGYASCGWECVG